jgi:hypothetical protein
MATTLPYSHESVNNLSVAIDSPNAADVQLAAGHKGAAPCPFNSGRVARHRLQEAIRETAIGGVETVLECASPCQK